VPSSIHDSDESDDETGSDGEESEVPASQEEEADSDGVIPDDIEPGQSPIDGLKTFDWGGADDELQDFLDGDSGNESDSSNASKDSSRSSRSARGIKRTRGEVMDDDDSDTGSATLKKQRISNTRTTGLKTVTPNSGTSSLPTPGPTDERDSGGESGVQTPTADNDFGDLEDELTREFEKEWEEQEGAVD